MLRSRRFNPIIILIFTMFLLAASLSACDGADLSATSCSQQNFWVNTTVDINDGACNEGHCSLREAIIAANTCTAFEEYRVWLPPGNYVLTMRGPGDERGDLDITRNVTITGAAIRTTDESAEGVRETEYFSTEDPGLTTIRGAISWNDRLMDIGPGALGDLNSLQFYDGNSSLNGGAINNSGNLIVRNAFFNGNKSDISGGGIANTGFLSLRNVDMSDNFAWMGSGLGCGGAIYNEGQVQLYESNIHSNDAYHGRGICSRDGIVGITDSMIVQNGGRSVGIHGLGGGLHSQMSEVTITNSEISRNHARTGGGIYLTSGPLVMLGSQVNNNEAANGGGLFAGASSTIDVDGTTFDGNHAMRLSGRDGSWGSGEGGGVNITTNDYDFYQSPITNNSADLRGGGMYINYGGPGRGFFSHSVIAYNQTDYGQGAGVYVHRGDILLANATLSSNEGPEHGVAIYNGAGSDSAFVYVTMAYNTANTGTGAVAAIFNEEGGQLSFESSILIGINRTAVCLGDLEGYSSDGWNILFSPLICNFRATSDQSFMSGLSTLIGPLLEIDGTLAHIPAPGGDAIDYIPERECVRDDQRLADRPDGTACDVGAIELDASLLSLEVEVPLIPTPAAEGDPTATAITNASCRKGADPQHAVHNFLFEGETALVIGRLAEASWLYVELPNELGRCWIFTENLDLVGPISRLPLFTSPELPSTDDGGGDDDSGGDSGGNDGGGGNNDGGGGNNDGGGGNNSGSAPDAPSNANISNRTCDSQDYFFTIVWQDNSNNEDGFRILRDGNLIATVGPNVESYKYTPPGSGPYTFTIEAFNDNGIGKTTVQEPVCFV